MNMKLKNLPIGISDFETIINEGYLYIDKTQHIYNLISTGMYYFLSRPRRFGKSLLISTFYNLFRGKKELFKGLYIYNSDYKWDEYPVISLDFNEISNDTPDILKESIEEYLRNIGKGFGIEIKSKGKLKEVFKELVVKIGDKTGKDIVFLIDEYDKPIIDHLGRGNEDLRIADENRKLLKSFYGVLKGKNIVSRTRFVFITGITKFSKVSIFSELNNLTDLTMVEDYSEILGITEQEIDEYLSSHIDYFCKEKGIKCDELREELRDYYNGYRFSSKEIKVYNPFSLFTALKDRNIRNYWFETGTPTFLINLIKEQNIYLPEYENLKARESLFSTYELSHLSPLPLMFQTGYLTIKGYEEDVRVYSLGFPNKEVKVSFTENLYYEWSGLREDTKFAYVGAKIVEGKIEEAMEIMKSIYSEIPYTLLRKGMINEAYFHIVFYLIISASGVGIRSEILTAKGRIDALIETKDRIYIIEFKCNQSSDVAIQQIKDNKYFEPYKNRDKEIILIGINFSTQEKNINDYKIDKIL